MLQDAYAHFRVWSNELKVAKVLDANSSWTRDLHHGAGNITLSDGSVHQLSSRGLQEQTIESDPLNNNNHARTPD
jgi:hypothetical protein